MTTSPRKTLREPDANLNELSYQVFGAAIEVHKELGPGYLESVYEDALCIELDLLKIPYKRQYPVAVSYKGHQVGESRLDLFVDQRLIVELKAVEALADVHRAQVISYLKATNCLLGLLINFNVSILKSGFQRIVLS